MTAHFTRRYYLTRARTYLALAAEWDRRAETARSIHEKTGAEAVATTYRHLAVANRMRCEGALDLADE